MLPESIKKLADSIKDFTEHIIILSWLVGYVVWHRGYFPPIE